MNRPDKGPALWAQRHPLLVLLLALLVSFGGLLAVGRLAIDPPSFDGHPRLLVRIQDPGVPAAIMESRVTVPLEQALADIPGQVDRMSVSTVGSSQVALFAGAARDTEAMQRAVAERLARTLEKLPTTIDAPQLTLQAGNDPPVAEILLGSSTLSLAQLQTWVEDSLVPQFTDIPGFARYELLGGPVREIRVIPDQRRLAALGLSLEDVVSVLRRYKSQALSHRQIGVTQVSAQAVDALTLRLANGDTVALSEVASAQEEEVRDAARVYRDAAPVLRLLLYRQPGTSTLGMGESFKARLAWLRTNRLIAPAVQVEWVANPLLGLKRMGRGFLTLSMGVILLTLVLIGGLYRRARAVWLGAVAAAVSLMLVFAFYKLAGLAISMLSLGGLVVGYAFVLGLPLMTFDRLCHPAPGEDAGVARLRAQHQLVTLLILSVLVLVPLWAFGGPLDLVFRDLVIGLLVTLTASVLASVLLVPAFAGAPAPVRETPLDRGYAWMLLRLRRIPVLLAVSAALAVLAIPIGLLPGRDNLLFLPPLDNGEVRLRLALPPGHDPEQVERLLRAVHEVALRNGDVNTILYQTGGIDAETGEGVNPNAAILRVTLQTETAHRRSAAAWSHDFERLLALSPPLGQAVNVVAIDPPLETETPFEDPALLAMAGEICLRITGPDREVLSGLGARMLDRLAVQPGLRNVRLTSGGEQEEMVAQVDPEKATDGEVDEIVTARVLRIAHGGLAIGSLPDNGRGVGLRIFIPPPAKSDTLPRLLLRGETDDRGAVYLNDVASGRTIHRPQARWRERQRPMVEIRAAMAADASPGEVIRNARAIAEHSVYPSGYQGALVGFVDSMRQSLKRAAILLGVSSLLLLLLGLRLRSLRGVLFILANVLFSVAGAVAGVVWAGLPLSLPMVVGVVLLAAIGAAPSLMALYVLLADRGGASAPGSVAAQRIGRPLLVFGVGGLLSLLPLAGGLVPGFELLQPLALVLGAGLCFSLLGCLFLVPVLFPWRHR